MPLDQPANAANDTPNQEHEITANCDLLWSLAQEFSYIRLSDKNNKDEYELIGLYAARARRIAATYARFYLETEEGGDTSKIGRYYWMALGAFASKTVGCLLDTFQLQGSYFLGWVTFDGVDARAIANGLAKGNLWLFGDIAPAHWFYNHYPDHFFNGMACIDQRHVNKLERPVKDAIHALPWSAETLGTINHFQASSDLIEGFEYVVQIEQMAPSTRRREKQMDHLMAIANHEQGAVLQPLIYEDPVFSKWTARERHWLVRWAAPTYELVFTHQCSERDPELKSVAPNDMIVENFESRMHWIERAADKFNTLMNTKSEHMLAELNTIARWVDSPDAWLVY